MSAPIRIQVGDVDSTLFLVEDEGGAIHLGTETSNAAICVAEAATAEDGLRDLRAAVAHALRELEARRREGAS